MTGRRGLLGNSMALASGHFVANILGLIFTATFARSRGPEGLGMFQYAASIAALASLVVSLGLDVLVVREVARDKARAGALAAASLLVKAVLSLPALALVLIIAGGRYGGVQGQLLMVVAGAALLDAMSNTLTAVFRGFERMEYEAAVVIAGSVVSAVAGTAAIAAGWSLTAAMTCWALGSVVKAAASALLVRGRFISGALQPPRGILRNLAGASVACGSMALIGAIYSNADIVMLREMATEREVGWYTAATKLIVMVLYVPSVLTASLFPVLSRQTGPSSRGAARAQYERAYWALFLVGLPAGAGALLLARPVVRLVYGDGFEMSATALMLLSPYLGWFFINLVNGTAMIAWGRQTFLAVGTGIATAFNLAANLWAIPRYGLAGACVTTVIASGAGAILYTCVCHRDLRLPFRWAMAGRGIVCTAVMSVCVAALDRAGVPVLVVIPVGAIIYAAGLAASGVLPLSVMIQARSRLVSSMQKT